MTFELLPEGFRLLFSVNTKHALFNQGKHREGAKTNSRTFIARKRTQRAHFRRLMRHFRIEHLFTSNLNPLYLRITSLIPENEKKIPLHFEFATDVFVDIDGTLDFRRVDLTRADKVSNDFEPRGSQK